MNQNKKFMVTYLKARHFTITVEAKDKDEALRLASLAVGPKWSVEEKSTRRVVFEVSDEEE